MHKVFKGKILFHLNDCIWQIIIMCFSNLSVLFYSLVIVFHYYNSLFFFTPLLGFTFLHFNVITDMKCA